MTPDTESSKDLTTAEQSHTSVKQNLDTTPDTEKCKHNVVGKYCFRCKRPDLACRCNCLNFYKIECNCPCHSQVEIEQNAETGEVLTANGIELIPQQRGGWEEDFELCFRYFFMDMADGAVKHDIKCFIRTLLSSRDTYWKERVRKETESKDGAYHERDMLVCALSKLFPSYLARHREEDTEWENDWRWIVYIEIPTKVKVVSGDQHNHILESKWFETKIEQISWHIHDSEREMFNHLEVKENNWDGHNTERKYQRLQALDTLLDNLK